MLSAISNDLCSNEQIFIISCDLWRLADSILFLQKSLFSELQVTPGKKKNQCNHLRAAWVKIRGELEVQDC